MHTLLLTGRGAKPMISHPRREAPSLSNYYALLRHDALLHLTGPDALKFLQGQVTCDTRRIDPSHALPGAHCTPQGRVVCDFLLCEVGPEHLVLRMRRDLREHSAATFGKYIIFSKAELHPGRDDWILYGCWGEQAATGLQTIFGEVPAQQYASCAGPGFVLVQTDSQGRQFECYVDSKQREDLQEQLATALQEGSETAWQALQIAAGIGRIESVTTEEFVPQMLNYDHTGHISFNKGCYTGQEVVARLHYRGKPKRRMYRATLPEAAAAGTPLYCADSSQSVGNVVNSIQVDGAGAAALVVVAVSRVDDELRVGSPDGMPLELTTLPYSIDDTD